jgi:hypothetical protein
VDWVPAGLQVRRDDEDRRLTGIRLPMATLDHRRLAARDIVPERWFDSGWARNILTRASRNYVYAVDSIDTWENEGGR